MAKNELGNVYSIFFSGGKQYDLYECYKAMLVPLKRKNIYGERRVVPLDANNDECSRVFYDERDMTLYPKKSTGLCKLNEDGTLYSGKEQKAQKNNDQDTDMASIRLKELKLSPMWGCLSHLNYTVDNVYTLSGYDSITLASIIGENLFEVSGYSIYNNTWMFQRNGTVFLLSSKKRTAGKYAEKNMGYQIDDEPLISDITELDDIDFAMF